MLFDIPFVADWRKIGEQRQSLTDRGNQRKNAKCIDYDYKVGDKVLVINEGILCKAESAYGKEPWTITTVHTNGGVVHANVGQNVTPHNPSLGLFLNHFLHMMSS
jgi:hypothetical protein